MAVQQNRKTRSRRDMRRSHDAITGPTLSVDKQQVKCIAVITLLKMVFTAVVNCLQLLLSKYKHQHGDNLSG